MKALRDAAQIGIRRSVTRADARRQWRSSRSLPPDLPKPVVPQDIEGWLPLEPSDLDPVGAISGPAHGSGLPVVHEAIPSERDHRVGRQRHLADRKSVV